MELSINLMAAGDVHVKCKLHPPGAFSCNGFDTWLHVNRNPNKQSVVATIFLLNACLHDGVWTWPSDDIKYQYFLFILSVFFLFYF